MAKFKKIRFYLIACVIITIGLVLLFNKALVTGLIVLGIAAVMIALWELFLREKIVRIEMLTQEIQQMKAENNALKHDIHELATRKLNISEVNTILDLGLIEVDTNFKRTVNRTLKEGDKSIQFIGVLHVDFIAKYGVDFRKLQYKVDEERREICIANANPQFLSFSKRNCIWEIAEIFELNEPFFGSRHWKTNPKLDKIASQIKEEVRMQTERETENGPRELDWIIRPLRKHVETAIGIILRVEGYAIRLTELDSGNYKPLTEYTEDNGYKKILTADNQAKKTEK